MGQDTLYGKNSVPRYDSHVVLVNKRDGGFSDEAQFPAKPSAHDSLGAQLWTEFCLFESSHILPLCLLHF
jgi:hypothetical protein